MKLTCKDCHYCTLITAPDKSFVHACMYAVPVATIGQTSKGPMAVNMPRPTVQPDHDYCHQLLAKPAH